MEAWRRMLASGKGVEDLPNATDGWRFHSGGAPTEPEKSCGDVEANPAPRPRIDLLTNDVTQKTASSYHKVMLKFEAWLGSQSLELVMVLHRQGFGEVVRQAIRYLQATFQSNELTSSGANYLGAALRSPTGGWFELGTWHCHQSSEHQSLRHWPLPWQSGATHAAMLPLRCWLCLAAWASLLTQTRGTETSALQRCALVSQGSMSAWCSGLSVSGAWCPAFCTVIVSGTGNRKSSG
eukprot:3856962-Amphidinium_carterae.1